MEDSKDKWKYMSLLGKFVINFIDVSISKSFGVLIPVMIHVLSTNTRTLGFVCSLCTTWMYLACPVIAYVLQFGVATPRRIAMLGAFLSSLCLVASTFITSVPLLAICLSISGVGLSMGYLSSKIMLNEYFKKNYVLMIALASFGKTTGALIAPFIVERSLEAYGFPGALLILAGICLHAIPASATLRKPRTKQELNTNYVDSKGPGLLSETLKSSFRTLLIKKSLRVNLFKRENCSKKRAGSFESCNSSLPETLKKGFQNCFPIREPLLIISLPCIFLTSFGFSSWLLFLVPRAEWRGVPSSRAVLLSTIAGAGGIVGRLFYIVLVYLGTNAIVLACIFNMLSAITFVMDPLITTFPEMCVMAFIQGWCVFCCGLAISAYPKYAVKDDNFAIASGLYGLLAGLGANLGGFLSGLIKDTSQSFTTVFLVIGGVYAVNEVSTLMFLIHHRRKNENK